MSGIASLPVGRWAAIHTACRTPTPSSAACPPCLVLTDTSVPQAMAMMASSDCCRAVQPHADVAPLQVDIRSGPLGEAPPGPRCGAVIVTGAPRPKTAARIFLSLCSFLPTTQRGVGVLLTGGVRIHVASQHKVGKRNLDGWRRGRDGHAPALDPCQAAIFCAALSLFSTTPLLSSGGRLFFFSCSWSCTCDSWNLSPCQAGGFSCIVTVIVIVNCSRSRSLPPESHDIPNPTSAQQYFRRRPPCSGARPSIAPQSRPTIGRDTRRPPPLPNRTQTPAAAAAAAQLLHHPTSPTPTTPTTPTTNHTLSPHSNTRKQLAVHPTLSASPACPPAHGPRSHLDLGRHCNHPRHTPGPRGTHDSSAWRIIRPPLRPFPSRFRPTRPRLRSHQYEPPRC